MSGGLSGTRYHGLDGLRAALMFLGIWFHAAVAYSDGERRCPSR